MTPPTPARRRARRALGLAAGALALVVAAACQPVTQATTVPRAPKPPTSPAKPTTTTTKPPKPTTTTTKPPAPTTTTTAPAPATDPVVAGARYVSPSGSDSASGTASAPWRTVTKALRSVKAGDTVYVRGGTYTENVKVSASQMRPGTASSPVRILAYPGERPVIRGLLHLTGPSYWHLEGINVTWNTANSRGEHMVKLLGGTGWRFTGAEVWGARSYAAILVGKGARSFRIDNSYVHDTYKSNDLNQDHLIYVDNGHDGSGLIERNVLAGSPNGRGVKLGPGSISSPGTNNIVIRYNTFYRNQGPSNVQFSGSSSNNQVYGNLMHTSGSRQANVTHYKLSGTNNVVRDNLGWQSSGIAAFGGGIVDGKGNVSIDPRLADPANGDFRQTAPAAKAFGAHAP